MGDVMECQYRRCTGVVPIEAAGLDDDGTPVRGGTCRKCGRPTWETPPVEQDALPGMEAS